MKEPRLTLVSLQEGPAERARVATLSAKADSFGALEQALQLAEKGSFALFDLKDLALLPAGVRDRVNRLAVAISAEVCGISAMAERAR